MQLHRTLGVCVAALAVVAGGLMPAAAAADDAPLCPSSTEAAYAMTAEALTGPAATDVTLTFTRADDGSRRVRDARSRGPRRRPPEGHGASPRIARRPPNVASTETEPVRCTACRVEYEVPPRGVEPCCPGCGSPSWVSARFPPDPDEPSGANGGDYARLM